MPNFEDALKIAHRLLERRAFSEKAMRESLEKKGLKPDLTEAVISKLTKQGFLSDSRFAENLADAKQKDKLWGDQRIREAMARKGIAGDVAEEALRKIKASDDSVSEPERAYLLILRREKQAGAGDLESFERKMFDYLSRRGFDPDTIESALSRFKRKL